MRETKKGKSRQRERKEKEKGTGIILSLYDRNSERKTKATTPGKKDDIFNMDITIEEVFLPSR